MVAYESVDMQYESVDMQYESVDMHIVATFIACLITLRCGQIVKLVLRL